MDRYKLLIPVGSLSLIIAFALSIHVSYLKSPHVRVTLTLQLPTNSTGEAILGSEVAEKLYYNISSLGDRHVQLNVSFYNNEDALIGGFYMEYAGVNSSGWLVLPESPYRVRAKSSCTTCKGTTQIMLLYSQFSRGETNTLSIISSLLSLLGMSMLTGGLYEYVAEKRLEARRPRRKHLKILNLSNLSVLRSEKLV